MGRPRFPNSQAAPRSDSEANLPQAASEAKSPFVNWTGSVFAVSPPSRSSRLCGSCSRFRIQLVEDLLCLARQLNVRLHGAAAGGRRLHASSVDDNDARLRVGLPGLTLRALLRPLHLLPLRLHPGRVHRADEPAESIEPVVITDAGALGVAVDGGPWDRAEGTEADWSVAAEIPKRPIDEGEALRQLRPVDQGLGRASVLVRDVEQPRSALAPGQFPGKRVREFFASSATSAEASSATRPPAQATPARKRAKFGSRRSAFAVSAE